MKFTTTMTDTQGMDPLSVLSALADSPAWAVVALVVFLVLTTSRQGSNKHSGRSVGTGRHRAPDAGETEERDSTPQRAVEP